MKEKIKLIIAISIIVLTVSVFVGKGIIIANAIKMQEANEKYYDWLVDNCKCLENERAFCREGFELSEDKKICRGDGTVTNILRGCSKYDCDGEVVSWDNESKLWSPILNIGEGGGVIKW